MFLGNADSTVNFTTPRVICGRPQSPEIVMNLLDRSGLDDGGTVLDIGPGNGRLASSIATIHDNVSVVGLELDPILCDNLHLCGHPVVEADATSLPFGENTFNSVVAINACHEICFSDPFTTFQQLLKGFSRVLKPGGSIIIFDGVMPAHAENQTCQIRGKTPEAQERIDRFMAEYTAGHEYEAFYYNGSQTNTSTLAMLQSKWGYIDRDVWEGESTQLYLFLTLEEMATAAQNARLIVEEVHYPQGRCGVKSFLQDVEVTCDGNIVDCEDFPQTQVVLRLCSA